METAILFEPTPFTLPDRGRVGVICLIITEFALFTIFVVAYLFYLGKTLTGPRPNQVLDLPVFSTICLLSSSVTVGLAEKSIRKRHMAKFGLWTAATILLGITFLEQTAVEWRRLIVHDHLTISTNVFGTTFYSLVGLHASHVVLGLVLLTLTMLLNLRGSMRGQERRFGLLAWYWHFVDVVWIVVFTVVYVVGR